MGSHEIDELFSMNQKFSVFINIGLTMASSAQN